MVRHRLSKHTSLGILTVVVFILLQALPRSFSHTSSPQASRVHFVPSSFNWTEAKLYFPPAEITPLPKGKEKKPPRIQHEFGTLSKEQQKINSDRREAVKQAFLYSWNAYKQEAWLWDEVKPVSGGGKNTFGGWAATLVDSLDSLWIFGLYEDFYEAAQSAARLDWADTDQTSANMFETTIRHLGGLLSAYDLSGELALLEKAEELGAMLYMGFDTPNRLPGFWLNFEDAQKGRLLAGTNDPSASPSSLSLEFTRLAQLTNNDKYYDAIDRVRQFLVRTQDHTRLSGMWPTTMDFRNEAANGDTFTLGALSDSLYEYLPKMHILTGGLEPSYELMYRKAIDTATKYILFRPMHPDQVDILFAGDAAVAGNGQVKHTPEGQHLSCFTGAMYILGGKIFDIKDHVDIGVRLARGCAWAYSVFPTGLMPEIFGLLPCPSKEPCQWDEKTWNEEGDHSLNIKGFQHARDTRYILRPEAIESIFYAYRATGQEELRDVAWEMFQSIVNATKTPLAYSAISDVTAHGDTDKMDSMESFWTAETLKYFYLIFSSPDVVSLDDYVLNTEAHPLRRPN